MSENRAATRPPGAEARIGDLESAQRTAERALALSRGIFEPPHSQIARTLAGLGIVLNARGQTAASADAFRQALDMRREILGEGSPHLIPALSNVGTIESQLGRHEAALGYFREAERACRDAPSATRTNCGLVRHRIAAALLALGQHEQAELDALAAYEQRVQVFGTQSGDVASTLALLSDIARHDGRTELALERAARAAQIVAELPEAARNVRAEVGVAHARALVAAGRAAAALDLVDALIARWREESPQETFHLSRMLTSRYLALRASGSHEAASETAAEVRRMAIAPEQVDADTRAMLAETGG